MEYWKYRTHDTGDRKQFKTMEQKKPECWNDGILDNRA